MICGISVFVSASLFFMKRIESIIDKLQSSILEKVGSYGSNLDSIKKEMSMMQDSFGRIAEGSRGKSRAVEEEPEEESDEEPAEKISKKRK